MVPVILPLSSSVDANQGPGLDIKSIKSTLRKDVKNWLGIQTSLLSFLLFLITVSMLSLFTFNTSNVQSILKPMPLSLQCAICLSLIIVQILITYRRLEFAFILKSQRTRSVIVYNSLSVVSAYSGVLLLLSYGDSYAIVLTDIGLDEFHNTLIILIVNLALSSPIYSIRKFQELLFENRSDYSEFFRNSRLFLFEIDQYRHSAELHSHVKSVRKKECAARLYVYSTEMIKCLVKNCDASHSIPMTEILQLLILHFRAMQKFLAYYGGSTIRQNWQEFNEFILKDINTIDEECLVSIGCLKFLEAN